MDEWLRKWNRTCPLCKSTIKRKGTAKDLKTPTAGDETSPLVQQEVGEVLDPEARRRSSRGGYGAMDSTGHARSRHHHMDSISSSSCSSRSREGSPKESLQVVAAEIELSSEIPGEDESNAYSTTFHTPEQSDTEQNAYSFGTAHGSLPSGASSPVVV